MMDPPLHFKCLCTLLALLLISTTRCKSEQDAVDIITKAMACFDDQYVYSSCQESYRLKAQGSINVPPEAVNVYCGGPCLRETKLVLHCLHNILGDFRFYNGATLRDIRYTIDRGCGQGKERGDFNALEEINDPEFYDGDYNDYDKGNKPTFSVCLLVIFIYTWLFYGY